MDTKDNVVAKVASDYQKSHYGWLEDNLVQFFKNLGREDAKWWPGIIGDKGYQYKDAWQKNGIPFEHGMALFLLSCLRPYRKTEVYDWLDNPQGKKVEQWVIDNYQKFKPYLPPSFEERKEKSDALPNL